MTAVFILWAGIIPLVPLLGAQHFKRKNDAFKKHICIALFILQGLLSLNYILTWLNVH